MKLIRIFVKHSATALFLLLSLAGAAYAQSAIKLAVVPDSGASGDPSVYHFSPEEAQSGPDITHVFTLKNGTSASVTIVRIDASCSCTTAVVQSGGLTPNTASGITALAPGAEAKIKVTVGLGDAAAGPVDKAVWVRVLNQTDPAATLHITGTVEPPVIFAPATLDFGNAAYGQPKELVFAVGISPRAPDPGANPVPASSVPYVKIAPFNHPMPAPDFPKNYRVLAYQATLTSDAPMGPFEGTISLPGASGASTAPAPGGTALVFGAGPATTQAVAPVASSSAALPVRGEITGDLASDPKTAVFGTITAGKAASLNVVVTSRSGQNLSRMTFTGDQPWLSAHVAGPIYGGWSVQLDIGASAPAGAQSASLTGQIGDEKIVIPVLAYVVSEK